MGKGREREGEGEGKNNISLQLSKQESCSQDMGDPGGILVTLALTAQTSHVERPVAKEKLLKKNFKIKGKL